MTEHGANIQEANATPDEAYDLGTVAGYDEGYRQAIADAAKLMEATDRRTAGLLIRSLAAGKSL
jgi:hypothetical protein